MSSPISAAGRNALLDTSSRPDAVVLGDRFEGWARRQIAPDVEVRHAAFPQEGGSSYNLLVDLVGADGEHQFVVKLGSPAPEHQVFPDEDLFRQAGIMAAVATATDLPMPTVVYAEADPRPLGVPFLVLRRCPGRAWPSDPPYTFAGWALDATPQDRQVMQHALVEVLAKIHSVTEDRFDLAEFRRPELGATPLAEQVGALHRLYEWGRAGLTYPLVERALAWLDVELPRPDSPAGVTWGDARAGNLLFTGTAVTAVLDWEGAALGPGEVDLAFGAMMHRYYQDRAESHGLPGLPDCFGTDELWSDYAEVSGREPADPQWFLVLAATRAATIQIRFLARSYADGRSVPDDVDAQLGVGDILRRLLDSGQL